MTDLPARCADLNGQQVTRALRSKDAMRALLDHLARVAVPREGATKILVPICQMASKTCTWIDTGLIVELSDVDGERTKILIALDLGGGAREALFPKVVLDVPFAEFASAVTTAPRLVEPMTSRVKKRSIMLAADAEAIASVAPPAFAIAEESWRRSLPPAVRLSLGPPLATFVEVPRLAPQKALLVDENDLRELRSIAVLDDPDDVPVRSPRASRAPTRKPPPVLPSKKVVVRKKA